MEIHRKCFVIMPFSKSSRNHSQSYWTSHFENYLKPEIEQLGDISVFRSEELRGDIVKEIIIDLDESYIVIADLTDLNPNVFWELGVRQSLQYKTITIAENGTVIPFDVSTNKVHFYNRHKKDDSSNKEFYEGLRRAVQDCIDHPDKPDSLVLDILGNRAIERSIITGSDQELEMRNTISDFINLLKKLYESRGVMANYYSIKVLNDKRFDKYLGVYPGYKYGKEIGDHEIYFLSGKYFLIPNSLTLRRQNPGGDVLNIITKGSSNTEFETFLEILRDEILEFILAEFEVDLR